ncbi:MAG: hypothetical protein FJW19_00105 [Actinobacteria bacterium]|nr:hypothetical protein [Actinomycetota bacterium]
MNSGNFRQRILEQHLRTGVKSLRELREDLRITAEQMAFFLAEAEEIELRAMVAETADAALAHHQAQRNLSAIQKHHEFLLSEIADHEARQDVLLDKLEQ